MEWGPHLTVSKCACLQGYTFKQIMGHPDERHNHLKLVNSMSIFVFQHLLVSVLQCIRCICVHVEDPWMTGQAQVVLAQDVANDFESPAYYAGHLGVAAYFSANSPGLPVPHHTVAKSQQKHATNKFLRFCIQHSNRARIIPWIHG